MQKRLKRIFALICAFALLITTVPGNGAMKQAQAAASQEAVPVTLDGFENVTIKDFSKNGTQMPEKAYGNTNVSGTLDDFSLTSGESLDKKLLSMKVKFEGGGGNTRIDVAGSGAWSGFSIFSNNAGDYLQIYTNYGFASPAVGIDMAASTAEIDSFINNEFLLQLSMEFVDSDNDGAKDDLKVGVYVNGKLYNGAEYIIANCNTAKFGGYIGLYREDLTSVITVKSVKIEEEVVPVQLAGFDNLTLKDFADANGNVMEAGEYNSGVDTSSEISSINKHYSVNGLTSFDNKLLSVKVKFSNASHKNSIVICGAGEWKGFNVHAASNGTQLVIDNSWASSITSLTPIYMDAKVAGVDSFLNEEFLLQMSFEYGEVDANNKADLTLGVYINGKLYNNQKITIADCNMSNSGSGLALYVEEHSEAATSIIVDNVQFAAEPIKLEGFTTVTVEDFIDSTGNQMQATVYNDANSALEMFSLKNYDSFDQKLVSFRVKFNPTAGGNWATRLDIGGNGGWNGITVRPNADGKTVAIGDIYGQGTGGSANITDTNAKVVSLVDNEFLLQMSFAFGDVVSGKADLTIGIYINGTLCTTHTLTSCDMTQFGKYLRVYRETGSSITLGSINESEPETPEVPEVITPVTLDGFTSVTIRDFVDGSGTQMEEKRYAGEAGGALNSFSLKDHTSFNKLLLDMNVKFEGGGGNARIDLAGSGDWSGISIFANNTGNYLHIYTNYGATSPVFATDMSKETAKIDTFLNKEFLLQLSFEFGDYDSDGAQDDLKLGVYINGKLYNNEVFTIEGCNMSKIGKYIGLYREGTNTAITLGSVGEETTADPIQPDESFEKITFSHFEIEDATYPYVNGDVAVQGKAKGRDTLDKTVVCGDILLTGSNSSQIIWGGTSGWDGLRMFPHSGGTMQLSWYKGNTGTPIATLDAATAGVDFIGEKYTIMLSSELVANDADGNKNDIKIGIWFNGNLYNQEYIIVKDLGGNMGNSFSVYCGNTGDTVTLNSDPELKEEEESPAPPTEPQQPDESFEKITFAHFGVKDGTYKYNGDIVVRGNLKEKDTLDKTVLCGDILLDGNPSFQLIFGGKGDAWDGLRLILDNPDAMHLYWFGEAGGQYITSFTPIGAGVDFVGKEFNLMLSMEVVGNDIKVGAWFDGVLYGNQYITISDCADELGNRFAGYCSSEDASIVLNSIPELVPPVEPPKQPNENFEKITFEYFGVKDGTYKCDGTNAPTYEGKGNESLDQKVLCGDILFSGKGENHLMVGGNGNTWYGLRFITQKNETIVLYWIDDEGLQLVEIFDATTAGTALVDEWINLMISTEIVDADGDGAKDDIEVGVWFNGVLYQEQFYTILDKASGLGKTFGFDCPDEGLSISIRSIPELVKGFDFSVFGYTKDWQKTLLTDHKAETAVGGSRDPEPFTGDLLEIGKVCLFGTVGIAVIVAGIYIMLQRKKES